MKLNKIASDIPNIDDERDVDNLDDEQGINRNLKFHKKFIHRPIQAMSGELNKEMHTPRSPTAFNGAAPTR